MYILFTDETNLPSDPNAKFFAYGGLIVPVEKLAELDERISAIRLEASYSASDELKFNTSVRPANVSIEVATSAKENVVKACIDIGCKFIVYVILHAIARNNSQETLIRWGADHVIGKFNFFLKVDNSYGIVAVDRLSSGAEYKLLVDRFTGGLIFPEEGTVPLDRIKLYSSTCINASHASSAMDIVLGSFRYCINAPRNLSAARTMMANIVKLIWCDIQGDEIHVMEKGLIFRPKNVTVPMYKAEYDGLLEHINALLIA